MSLPLEHLNALINARQFLRDLMDPRKTPRVPKKYRIEARYLLKHYPWDMDLEKITKCKKCSKIISEK